MKILLSLFMIALILSCSDSEELDASKEITEQSDRSLIEDVRETEDEEVIREDKAELDTSDRSEDICMETTISDCYIVGHFRDKEANYITVDFVNYKIIEGDSEPEFELVNEIKTLRTFLVSSDYLDCGRSKKVSIEKLIEQSEQDKKTVFNIETEAGNVIELFVRNCAG